MNEVSYIDREKRYCECRDCLWWGRCEVRLEDCEMREGIYVCRDYVSDEKMREIAERCEGTLKRLGE